MCIIKTIFKIAFKYPKLDSFQKYLFFSPHPDDSDVACGAFINRLVREGKEVYVANLTDGRYGDLFKYHPDDLIPTREKEDIEAKEVYGIKKENLIFMRYSDGAMYDPVVASKDIAKLIVKIKPDVILGPDHLTESECHPDHIKCGQALAHSIIVSSDFSMMHELGIDDRHDISLVAFYTTDKANRHVKVTKEDLEAQMLACSKHKSQFDDNTLSLYRKAFKLRAIRSGAKIGKRFGVSFRVLSSFLTHCVPEGKEA